MSHGWRARFEIVAGPYDGLTFTIGDEGVNAGPEIAQLPLVGRQALGDFDDVEFEVGVDGVKLTGEGSFVLNGDQVTGTREMHAGDVARIGATEVLLVDFAAGGPADATGTGGATQAQAGKRCPKPGCGAMNPPDAKWCSACGWDLGENG